MNNLRIVYDNAANRTSSLTASSTAGSLVAANLLTDIKSQTWRATGTSAALTATWAANETIACVALPFVNFTSSATIRARGYATPSGTLLIDTGAVPACPSVPAGLKGWGTRSLGANAFAYNGGAYAYAWFAPTVVQQLVIDLADSGNPAGYIEVSRLVVGNYWSPTYNADYGVALTPADQSKQFRTDAGDLLTDLGTRSRSMKLNLSNMPATDRLAMTNLLTGNGLSAPVFFSLYPGSSDPALEQSYSIYAKLSAISAITANLPGVFVAPLELEEV